VIIRRLADIEGVDWGNGISRRFLLAGDGMGYTLTDTIVRAGTRSPLMYTHHLEACYCIAGRGMVVDSAGNNHVIEPGTMYALDKNDPHFLIASPTEDLRLVCVFKPALKGSEVHHLSQPEFSEY
jgi:L-ectoine synthase